MARIKSGNTGGGAGGSGQDSSDLTNQLAILQQISGLYEQVNQSLQFQKSSLQEIAALNQQVCNNICVSNYSNATDTIVDLTAATNTAAVSTQNFNTQTVRTGKNLRNLQSDIDTTADGFTDLDNEIDDTTKNMKKSGGLLSKFFGNIKDSITGMGASALQGIFNIIDGLGKLTFSIMASPFMFMNKMFEIAGQGGDNSFALALEDIREEFGNLREGLAKDTIDIHKSMITDTKELIGMSAYRIFGEDRAAILQEALKTVKSLGASARPFIDTFGKDAVVKLALFQKGLGLSEEATKHLADSAMNAGKDISEVTTELTKMSTEMGRAIGESPKVISRAVGEAMKDLTAFGGATIKQLAKSEAYLRKLGSTMEEVKGLLSTFETLDTASEASAKLAQSFGVTVDAFKLMQMQDPGEQVDLLRKSFKDAGVDISKFNRQQHSLLADTLGLDAATAANVFSINKQGESFDKLGKKADEASKKQMSEAEALKEVADSIKRLIPSGQQVSGLLDALFQGFSTGVQRTSEWRSTMRSLRGALRDVRRAGIEIGVTFVKYFPGVKDMLGGLKEMFSGGKFRKFTQGFTKDLKQFFKDLSEGKASFPELFKKLKDKFFKYFDAANPAAKKMVDGIKKFLKTFAQIFAGIIKEVGKGLADGIRGIGKGGAIDKGVKETGDTIGFIFKELYAPVLGAVWEALSEIFSALFDKLTASLFNKVKELGKNFLDFLISSFTGAFSSFGGSMKFIAIAAIVGIIGTKIFGVLKSAFGPILNMIKSLFSAKGAGDSSSTSEEAKKAGDDASKMNWKSLGASLLGFMGFLLVLGILLKLGVLQYLVAEVSNLDPIGILNLVGLSTGLIIGMQKIAEVSSSGGKFDLKGLLSLFLGFGIFLLGLWGILELGILQSAIKKAAEVDTGELGKFVLLQLALLPALAAAAGIAYLMSKIKFNPGAAKDIAIGLLAASVVLLTAGVVLAGVAWMFKEAKIDNAIVETTILGLLGMVAVFTAIGAAILVLTLIGTKITVSLGTAVVAILAGLAAAALLIPAAAGLVILVSDMFTKNSITMEKVKIVTAGLLGMIAILIAASGAMIALAGGAVAGLVGGAVSWLSDKLFGKEKSDPFEFIKHIADELTKKPGGLIDKFTSNGIDKSQVDLVKYALDAMLDILFAAGTFVAAMGVGGAILALSGGLAIGVTAAGILASFYILNKITDSTKDLIDKVVDKKITQEQVKLVTETLDSMTELLYNVSIAMGAMAIGGIGGFVGAVTSIFTDKADPFKVMVKLIDIVSENAEKIKKINATPQDLESFKAFNIAIEGVTMLSDAAGKFILLSSQAAKLSGDSGNVEGILTSLNNLLSTLLGPNGIAGIITQITSFMQVVAGGKDLQESIKAFASLLSAVGNIMASMGSGISELGSKVAEHIDDDDMEKINEILKTAAESSTKMMQTSQESIIKILQTIEPMIANISSLNIKPEKAEAIGTILNAFAAIMKAITPDSATLSALKEKTVTKEDLISSEKIEEKLPIDSVTTYIQTIADRASMLISTIFKPQGPLDTIIQATSKMTKDQIEGLKVVGDLIKVISDLFKLVMPDPAVINALKVSVEKDKDGKVVNQASSVMEQAPIQEYMKYLTNIGSVFSSIINGIKPLIDSILTHANSIKSGEMKKLQDLSGVITTVMGILAQLSDIASPKTVTTSIKVTAKDESKNMESNATVIADVVGNMMKYMLVFESEIMPSMGRIINSLKSASDFNISDKDAKNIENIGKVITTITNIFTSLQSISESFKDSPAQDPAAIKQVTDTVAATGTKDKLSLMADAVKAAIGKITEENSPLREAIISLKDKGLSFLDANTGGNLIEKRMEKLEKIVTGISNVFTKLKELDDQLGTIGVSPAPNLINSQNIQNSGLNLKNNLLGLKWFGHNIDTTWVSDKDNPTYYLNLANQKLLELQKPIKNLTSTINSLNSSNDVTMAVNLQSQGLKNSISALVENLKTAYDDLNSIGSLKAQIQTEILNGELAASKSGTYEYKIDRAGVHFELSIEVNMKADEVETVLVKRKNSIIRNALNYTDKQMETITMKNNPEQLMPINQSNEALLSKYRAGGSK